MNFKWFFLITASPYLSSCRGIHFTGLKKSQQAVICKTQQSRYFHGAAGAAASVCCQRLLKLYCGGNRCCLLGFFQNVLTSRKIKKKQNSCYCVSVTLEKNSIQKKIFVKNEHYWIAHPAMVNRMTRVQTFETIKLGHHWRFLARVPLMPPQTSANETRSQIVVMGWEMWKTHFSTR